MSHFVSADLLKQLGLNDSEILVYSHLLEQGPSPAVSISKQSGVSRTNTYNVLEQLERRGLITKSDQSVKTIYSVEHPRALEEYLADQEQHLRATHSLLNKSMGDLLSMYSLLEARPGVFRFEGKEGMIRVYRELLRDRLDVCSIQDRGRLRTFIPDFNPIWLRERRKRKMFARIISVASKRSKEIEANDRFEMREVRYVDPKLFTCDMDLKINKDKVVITTFVRDSAQGIVIIDKVITRNFQALFDFFWQMLGK